MCSGKLLHARHAAPSVHIRSIRQQSTLNKRKNGERPAGLRRTWRAVCCACCVVVTSPLAAPRALRLVAAVRVVVVEELVGWLGMVVGS